MPDENIDNEYDNESDENNEYNDNGYSSDPDPVESAQGWEKNFEAFKEKIQIWNEKVEEWKDACENAFRCCLSDRSWTCILLGVIIFGLITGTIAALIVTQTRIIEYFKPAPYIPPNKMFSIDYLTPGYRYDFYREKETYDKARLVCAIYNTTLLVFDSIQEEKEIDCYLNVRNNAEDSQLIIWINETIIFGGPLMYARFGSFYSQNREEVVTHTRITIAENGCDVQKDFENRKAIWTADQQNTLTETTYNIAKVFGNNGLRSSSTNGCWNFVRWNEAANAKHNFICKSPIVSTDRNSLSNTMLFSQTYCD